MNTKQIVLSILIFCCTLFINAQIKEPIMRFNTEMHTSRINSISTDANEKFILTASSDKTAKLWDAGTGKLLNTFRPPIGYGREGELYAGAISPNGEITAVAGWTSAQESKGWAIYIFSTSTGILLQRFVGSENEIIRDLEYSHDGSYLAASFSGKGRVIVFKFSNSEGRLIGNLFKTLKGYNRSSIDIAFDKTGRLASVCYDGKIRLYNSNFKLKRVTTGVGNEPSSIAFSPDGDKLAIGYYDSPEIEVFSAKDLKLLYKPMLEGMELNEGLSPVCFSADGKFLYGGGGYDKFYDGEEWMVIRKWSEGGRSDYNDYPAAFSTICDIKALKNRDIIFGSGLPDFGRMSEEGNKIFYNAGEICSFILEDRSHLKVNNNGSTIVFTDGNRNTMQFSIEKRKLSKPQNTPGLTSYIDNNKSGVFVTNWDNNNTPVICGSEVTFLGENSCTATDISADGKKIIIGSHYYIYCVDTKKNILWKSKVRLTGAVNICADGKTLVSTEVDGKINWHRMSDGKLLLTLFAHPKTLEWVLYTPKGYFDCSPGAEKYLGWHVNQGWNKAAIFYPFSQFYEKYYIPDLGARVLAGEMIGEQANTRGFKLPPQVKITSPIKQGDLRGVTPFGNRQLKSSAKEIQVGVKATDMGGGIDEIRLYVNGKLSNAIYKKEELIVSENNIIEKNLAVELVPGINNIKLTAFNTQRTESLADEIKIIYEGVKKNVSLYVFVIGLDKYKNSKYNLNYALADATAFMQEIEKGNGSIFKNISSILIKNEEATKQGVVQKLNELKTKIKQEDVFVFYYAGHGVMSKENEAEFYITPHDVTQLYGNNEMLKSKAISATELQELSKNIKAQKQMFVLDACQSGGMVELIASRGAAEEKAIAQLARSTGTFWLAASNSEQFATEFKDLGHGVFTYAILKGLQGMADGGKKDKKITVKELSAFLNDMVPELSEKYKGSAQYPTSYGFGQDFPILILK